MKLIAPDGRLTYISENGCRLLEVDQPERVIGESWAALWPEEQQPVIASAIERALSGETARFTGVCPTHKGLIKWWDVAVSPVHDEQSGRITSLLAVSRDITRQNDIEQKLRSSESRFEMLADNISQLAWIADGDGSIIWYNRRWFDYTGTALEDMKGWGWQKVHHPDHVDRVVRKIARHFRTGEPWEDTFPLRAADGSYRWFLSRARPIRSADGKVSQWFGTNTDVTEQRETSQRLRQKSRLIELSHEAIVVWDLERGIVLWNRGCEQLYGFPQAEAIGASIHELLKVDLTLPREEYIAQLRRNGGWSGEVKHIARDGCEVWIESRQELVRIAGRELVLETNRDITERKRADEIRTLLIGELNHRVKNTLAIVQSIAGQTARITPDPKAFVQSFNGRLQALSAAHDVLTSAHWSGAGLGEVVKSQLAPFAEGKSVLIEGPEITLTAQSALQVSLMLHELVVNAIRFGALSRPEGQVAISWRPLPETSPAKVEIVWRERGGPPVTGPQVTGFGLTIIRRSKSLPHVDAEIVFEVDGVVCTVSADMLETSATTQLFDPGRILSQNLKAEACPGERLRSPRVPRVMVLTQDRLLFLEIEEALGAAGIMVVGPIADEAAALSVMAGSAVDVAIVDCSASDMPSCDASVFHKSGVPVLIIAEEGAAAEPGTVVKPFDAARLISGMSSYVPLSRMINS